MKVLKRVVLVLVVLFMAVVGVAFLLPSHVRVERAIVIAAPAEEVFPRVNDLKQWTDWSPWYALDPNANYEYSGAESGVGAKVAWDGEAVGRGVQMITKSEPYTRIETTLDFMEQGTATSDWTFEESGGQTKVIWGFDSDMGMNPIARYMGLMMDSMLGADYEKGLETLRQVCETTAPPSDGSDSADVNDQAPAEESFPPSEPDGTESEVM